MLRARTRAAAAALQRTLGRLLGAALDCRSRGRGDAGRLRLEDHGAEEARREFRRLRSESRAPLLVCANHLTMVDSAVIAWALGAPWWYVRHFAALPWNLPERTNFADRGGSACSCLLMKCLPIDARRRPRGEVGRVLSRFTALLAHGEVGLIFPEGGRSRSGRVERRRGHLRRRTHRPRAARLPRPVRLPARRAPDDGYCDGRFAASVSASSVARLEPQARRRPACAARWRSPSRCSPASPRWSPDTSRTWPHDRQ